MTAGSGAGRDVSVVLPVYWRDATPRSRQELSRAVASVLEQRYPGDLEILIVDDGSTPPLSRSLQEFSWGRDPRLRIVRIPRNGGLVNALNTGLAMARHGLIARIDADDAWRPGKVEKQLALLDADPDLTIVATGMRLVHAGPGTDRDLVRPGDWSGILRFFRTEGCPFPHGSVIARRDVYRLLGGYPHGASMSHCEDFALWGTWLRFFKPAMVEEVLFDYTVSSTSVSGMYGSQQQEATQAVLREFNGLGDVFEFPAALKRLAGAIDAPLLDAGRLAFRLWKHGAPTLVPEAAVEPLRILLPDRRVFVRAAERSSTPGERAPTSGAVTLELL